MKVAVSEILSASMVHLLLLIACYENMFPCFSFSHISLNQCDLSTFILLQGNDLLFLPNNDTIITHLVQIGI